MLAPHGCTLDAEGHIWGADGFGRRGLRVSPGGAIIDGIAGPDGMGVTPAPSVGTTAAGC